MKLADMLRRLVSTMVIAAACALSTMVGAGVPSDGTFTYQGRLNSSSAPASGSYDFEFRLYDALTAGNQIGPVQAITTAVNGGLFSAPLNFGAGAFAGEKRWLEISLRPNGGGSFTTLSPRVPVSPAPSAVYADTAGTATTALSLGAYPASAFSPMQWSVVSGPTQAASGHGYIVPTGSHTITLPASPAVGDIIRFSSGIGNWRIAQNPGQQIYTNYLSLTDAQWTLTETTGRFSTVACSANGQRVIAAGGGSKIYRSSDGGLTFTQHDEPRSWNSIAGSADGTKWAAATNFGIYTSSDGGLTWNGHLTDDAFSAIASSADGTRLAVVTNPGGIRVSVDSGMNWTTTSAPEQNWTGISSSDDGTKLAACAYDGQIYTTTDANATWTPRESGRQWWQIASSGDGLNLAACAENTPIYVSSDGGATWVPRETARPWRRIASSSTGRFLIASSPGLQLAVSSDFGATWSFQGPVKTWSAVAVNTDGTKFFAVTSASGPGPTSDANVYIRGAKVGSTTVGTAGYAQGFSYSSLELQHIGNDLFVPLGSAGVFELH